MKLKWGSEEINNFRMPTVEKDNFLTELIDKYFYWVLLGILIIANVWVWWGIYQLHLFRVFVKSI